MPNELPTNKDIENLLSYLHTIGGVESAHRLRLVQHRATRKAMFNELWNASQEIADSATAALVGAWLTQQITEAK